MKLASNGLIEMWNRIIQYIFSALARRLLPPDVKEEQNKINERLDHAFKELIYAFKALRDMKEEYDLIYQAQMTINQKLFAKMQDILNSLADHGIEVKDEDPTVH